MSQPDRPNSAFRKLLRKPAAVVSMCIIALTCFLAVFAYVLASDHTPYANQMVIELGARPPGFQKQLLHIPKSVRQEKTGKVQGWFSGTPSDYRLVPVNSYRFSADTLIINHYVDETIHDSLRYPFASLLNAEQLRLSPAEQQQYITEHLIRSQRFWLGTDRYGRDIFSRLLVGSRVSIAVGLIAVLLSLTIGIVLGSVAGYFRGITDNLVMWVINILWAIPTLLLVFAITLAVGKGFWEIFVAIGLTMWVSAARLIRGQVMVFREMEFVSAARALGVSDIRIIFRHILPNITGPLMVIAASNFATAILIEAGLSFLGIGVQPPQPSWGLMIKEHYNFLLADHPLPAIIPGLAIMLLVYAFNILGNALRDILDVRDQ